MILQWEVFITVAPNLDRNNIHKFKFTVNAENTIEAVEHVLQDIQAGILNSFMEEPKIKEIKVTHQPSNVDRGTATFSLVEGGNYLYGN